MTDQATPAAEAAPEATPEEKEVSGFEVTTSDEPVIQTEAQDDKEEGEAKPESESTEAEEKKAGNESGSGDDATESKQGKKSGAQKRINEVVKQRETAKRKAEKLERENELLRKQVQKPSDQGQKEQAGQEPKQEDFDSFDDYLDALDKYDQGAEAEKPAEPEPKQDKTADESGGDLPPLTDSQKTAMAVVQEAIQSADNLPEDFDAVALSPDVPVTGEMLEALAECEDPGKVLYHLGRNPDVAENIAGKTPIQQAKAIAKLELTVDNAKPKKPVKTPNAPDPITPVSGSDAQKKSLSEMTQAEYEAEMNARERSGGGNGWS